MEVHSQQELMPQHEAAVSRHGDLENSKTKAVQPERTSGASDAATAIVLGVKRRHAIGLDWFNSWAGWTYPMKWPRHCGASLHSGALEKLHL